MPVKGENMVAPTAITDPKVIKRLYNKIDGKKKETKQDTFLILLVTGCHTSVCAKPEIYNASFDGRVCVFQRTKKSRGALCRIVVPEPGHYMPVEMTRIKTAIRRWLDANARIDGDFPTSRKTIDDWLRDLGKKARYGRPLNAGTFRHTFCYQDLKAHKDLMRTKSKMRCSLQVLTDNYGLLADY